MTRSEILSKLLEEWRGKKVRNEVDLMFAKRGEMRANLKNQKVWAKGFKAKAEEIEGTMQRCDAFVEIIKGMMGREKPDNTGGEA